MALPRLSGNFSTGFLTQRRKGAKAQPKAELTAD
jgi:hypothetical protein